MTALQPGTIGHDGIRDAVVDAIEDAAHGAGIVDDAVGLSTLENGTPVNCPSIRQLALQRGRGKELGQFVVVAEIENVSAVKIRRPVGRAQIQRIVTVEEQAQAALLIQSVGISVGEAQLQSVAHALFDVRLQGVVGRDPGRGIAL